MLSSLAVGHDRACASVNPSTVIRREALLRVWFWSQGSSTVAGCSVGPESVEYRRSD